MAKPAGNRKSTFPKEWDVMEELGDLTGQEFQFADDLHLNSGFEINERNQITGISLHLPKIIKTFDRFQTLLDKLPALSKLVLTSNFNTNISSLSKLARLEELELQGAGIKNISFLSKLTALQELTIGGVGVTNLKPLSKLIRLKRISLYHNSISDITALVNLSSLEMLSLDNTNISDIAPIQHFKALRYLYLSHNNIHDFSPLAQISGLKNLHIIDNNFVDAAPLSALTGLRFLEISYGKISNITPLSRLTNLESLSIYKTNVSDIKSISNLTALEELNVRNNKISDITAISTLTKLKKLDLTANNINLFDPWLLSNLPNLQMLCLKGNPIGNVPKAITESDNCAGDLKNYFKDTTRGSIPAYEAKVILIGNGRVGKTCLVKRWLDNSFDAAEPSTHAIQLRPWILNELAQKKGLEKIRLNIWDFGGQDIYHATHRTFMNTEAIFLLVWDMQTETIPEQQETLPDGKTIRYKNHPIEYWLSYIKVLSNNSPVIIVQTFRNRDKEHTNFLTAIKQKEYNVKTILSVESSIDSVNGYDALKERIQEVVVEQIQQTCTVIPASWYNVRTRIAQMQEQEQMKQLSLNEFDKICIKEKLDKSSIQTLLHYFHNTGVFFYRESLFNNKIVIDQKWVIDAVYTLFNRKGYFARLHHDGHFKGEDLQEDWQQYSQQEKELFVSFMQQCEICFEVKDNSSRKKEFNEKVFIAPQLLPETPPLSVNALRRHGDGVYYKYRHRFLHTAIIQRFIVRTGNMAKENEMWQSGIVLDTPEGMALIESFPKQNEIVIRLDNAGQKTLLNKIRNEMKEINGDEAGIEELVSLDGIHFIDLERLKKNPNGNESILAENGNWVKAELLSIFLNLPKEEVFLKNDTIKKNGKKAALSQNKKRAHVPAWLMKLLQQEIDSKCPLCSNPDVTVLSVHHIDRDRSNSIQPNLILLCTNCHTKIHKKLISDEEVIAKKLQLQRK